MTSAAAAMAAKSGSKAPRAVFLQWRSPTVAIFILSLRLRLDRRGPVRDVLGGHLSVGGEPAVGITPAPYIGEVLRPREERAPAKPLGRRRLLRLALERPAQREHHARRNTGALARVDEAEERQVAEQDPPVGAEARHEPAPVELSVAGADQVGDVRAVVALALHHEGLGPDHLLRRAQSDGHAEHGRADGVVEPVAVDVGKTIARAVDDVDVIARDPRFPQPVRERQIRLETRSRQRPQEYQRVPPADEYVEVLRPPDALGVVPERIAAADQKRDARPRDLDERMAMAAPTLQGAAPRASPGGPLMGLHCDGHGMVLSPAM